MDINKDKDISTQRIVGKTDLLGQILLKKRFVTAAQLEEALAAQKKEGGLLGDTMVKKGFITEEFLCIALASQSDYCYIPVERYKVTKDILKLIPFEAAAKYNCIAIEKIGSSLTVVMANPLDQEAVKAIEAATHYKAVCAIGAKGQIEKVIKANYPI